LSTISKIKFFSALFKPPFVVILFLIWILSSNNFIFSANAIQELPPTITIANSTSFKAIATNSITTPFTNMHVHMLTSTSSKYGTTPFTNMHVHRPTSFSFNVLATTFAAKLPETLLPSYTLTNASDTRSEGILSAYNTLNNEGLHVQQSISKIIHGTIYLAADSSITGHEKER
jgi:hypothetical protein